MDLVRYRPGHQRFCAGDAGPCKTSKRRSDEVLLGHEQNYGSGAVLWRKRHKPGRNVIRRAVRAALILVFIIGVLDNAKAATPLPLPTKTHVMDSFAVIPILDFSYDVCNPAFCLELTDISETGTITRTEISVILNRSDLGFSSSDCGFSFKESFCSPIKRRAKRKASFAEVYPVSSADNVRRASAYVHNGKPAGNQRPVAEDYLRSRSGIWREHHMPDNQARAMGGNELGLNEFELALSSLPKVVGRSPEQTGEDKQPESKKGHQRIGNFEMDPEERRPELGSFILALLGVVPAVFFMSRNGIIFLFGFFLAFESTVGFLLGIDLWSIGKMLF